MPILETRRLLRWTKGGRLRPWLGSALRGVIARRLKGRSCRWPPSAQDTDWRYCRGCEHMAACDYGPLVEPDAPPGVTPPAGQADVARPLVIRPAYPAPERARLGHPLAVTALFIGRRAIDRAAAFWAAAADAGRDPTAGLGPDRVTFAVEPDGGDREDTVALPRTPDALPGAVPRLRIETLTPLVLTDRPGGGGRRLVTEPTFADLLRAGLRALGALHRNWGEPLDADFAGLKAAAGRVRTLHTAMRPFTHGRHSNRTGQRVTVQGVCGRAEYAEVPASLAAWVAWAGRLHVGTFREEGAGGWVTDDATK